MSQSPDAAAKAFIAAKEALEAAEAAKKEAEAQLKLAYASAGVDMTVVDGVKVTISESSRSAYDVEILRGLVKPTMFKQLTRSVVDADMLRACVDAGLVSADVADAATTKTSFTRVLISRVSVKSKSADRASSAA